MKVFIIKALTVIGFIFACISFLSLPIFIPSPKEVGTSLIISEKFIFFHLLPYALLGVFTAVVMRFEESGYVKKWSDRVIIANFIGLILGLLALIIYPIIFLTFKT